MPSSAYAFAEVGTTSASSSSAAIIRVVVKKRSNCFRNTAFFKTSLLLSRDIRDNKIRYVLSSVNNVL